MRSPTVLHLVLSMVVAVGCDAPPMPPVDGGSDAGTGLSVLGRGSHTSGSVEIIEVASAADRLRLPSDVAFHPTEDHQLWITNQGDDSVVIVSRAGSADRSAVRRRSLGSDHFLASPAGLAMGGAGTFATCQATDDVTQPTTPADFMGPSLWPADAERFDAGHASHLDMLHNSPNAVGIAWDHDNAFWVFDGYHESITYYDFAADHGPGGEDHSGAVITRYVEGEVLHATGVNAHIELDRATGLLYVADTANARVAVLDTRSGTPGRGIAPDYDDATMTAMDGATLSTLVESFAFGLDQPSGLALHGGVVYVTDRLRRVVHAFDLTGAQLDYLDLSDRAGELGGIEADVEGRLYVTTRSPDAVLRIAPLP